jgi:EAL domain-containing protein (putative c-di-GMP-specific phosphodiesterase class I)
MVRDALAASGLEARRLELEITESVLMQNTEAAVATLSEIKDLGVHIAMDDFGTGYSSLGYLQRFPFDKIKIDRTFIQTLTRRSNASSIIRAVISLGRSLGIQTCAEGVETEQQVDILKAEGCNEVQGYYFGKPMPAPEFEVVWGAWRREARPTPRAQAETVMV